MSNRLSGRESRGDVLGEYWSHRAASFRRVHHPLVIDMKSDLVQLQLRDLLTQEDVFVGQCEIGRICILGIPGIESVSMSFLMVPYSLDNMA